MYQIGVDIGGTNIKVGLVNEHVGYLYPAKDVAALAAVLKDVSHDPSIIIEMKKSCLEESKKYKLETVIRDFLNHLKV